MLVETPYGWLDVAPKTVPTFYFIGVTTARSAIMKVFPRWTKELGLPAVVIEGVDLPLHAPPERYRQATAQIKYDPLSLGALITAHKIDLYEAARDLFDYLDPNARICGEVSSLSKRDGRLEGHAMDPITSGISLDAVLGDGYFDRTGGELLCFGAGGSAAAIALHLIRKPYAAGRPRRFVVVNRSEGRLLRLQKMVEALGSDIRFEDICSQDPGANDRIMGEMPIGSLVINATGMGKDTPGSPITGDGVFPLRGVAWELNYRGDLDFLHQAQAQQASRALIVEDGWRYFLHGWLQVIAQVYNVTLDGPAFSRLAALAETIRSS